MSEGRFLWLAYAAFLLNGVGTVLLGPLLPKLESLWSLNDSQGGALLAAQFLGMTLGTIFVLRQRHRAMAVGAACSAVGTLAMAALVHSGERGNLVEALACAALLLGGVGLGQAITALNLGVGADPDGRASRLSFGNAMWSVGAIVAPIAVSLALRQQVLWQGLAGLAFVFLLIWPWALPVHMQAEADVTGKSRERLAGLLWITFAVLMLLYGGSEACVSGWVTTFARRAGGAGLLVSPLSTSAFWFGVAGGRMGAAVVLRRWPDREALLLLASGSAIASLGLVFGQSMAQIAAWAFLSGVMLGPAFAVIVAATLNRGASVRQAGLVLASCGFGATLMPLLLGVVSERTASLREALGLPGVCLLGMLLLVFLFVQNPKRADKSLPGGHRPG
jgi:fucose permease